MVQQSTWNIIGKYYLNEKHNVIVLSTMIWFNVIYLMKLIPPLVKDVDGIETSFNLPEEEARYQKFLENGSTKGLTPEELLGIRKVDEYLVLDRVDYDEVLALRRAEYEGDKNAVTIIDYSYKFDRELINFNDGYEIRKMVDKDLILVQYSSDAPDASLCYWQQLMKQIELQH